MTRLFVTFDPFFACLLTTCNTVGLRLESQIKGWPFVIPDPQYTGVSLCVMASAYAIRSWDEGSSSMLSSVTKA